MRAALLTLLLGALGAALFLALRPEAVPDLELPMAVIPARPCLWSAAPPLENRYQLSWQSQLRRLQPAAPEATETRWLERRSELRANLVVQAAEDPATGCSAWVSLEQIQRLSRQAQGAEQLADAAVLEGLKVLARWSRGGALLSVGFPDAVELGAQDLLLELLTELQVEVPDPGELLTRRGLVNTRGTDEDERWQRHQLRYTSLPGLARPDSRQELDGLATLLRDDAGQLQQLRAREALSVHGPDDEALLEFTQTLELQRDAQRPGAELNSVPVVVLRQPGEQLIDEAARRAALEQRAATLEADRLLELLRAADSPAAAGALDPDQACARLQLQPVLSGPVAELLGASTTTLHRRQLGVALLTCAGHAEAQTALRGALTAAQQQVDGAAFAQLLGQLGGLARPEAETVSYLRALIDGGVEPGSGEREAAIRSLGALTGNLRDAGRLQQAAPLVALLTAQLDRAPGPDGKRAWIEALGEAHAPGSLARLLTFAETGPASIRAVAASALRRYRAAEVTTRLVALAGDPSGLVQRSALASLIDRHLDEADLATLHGHVRDHSSASLSDPLLVELLARFTDHDVVRHTLGLLLQRSITNPQLRVRIRELLKT